MSWTDEDWCEVVNRQDERLKQYDSLVIKIGNILTEVGIPEYAGSIDERVKILSNRYRAVINLYKSSYVFTPADKDAQIKMPK